MCVSVCVRVYTCLKTHCKDLMTHDTYKRLHKAGLGVGRLQLYACVYTYIFPLCIVHAYGHNYVLHIYLLCTTA